MADELSTDFLYSALVNTGDELVKELTRQLLINDKVATRHLINSLDFDVVETMEGLTIKLKADYYLKYVDEGRSPGNFPPTKDIIKWIKAKGISFNNSKGKKYTKEQMGFVIARSIGRKGIKATNVINTSINNILNNLDSISEAYKQDILKSLSEI